MNSLQFKQQKRPLQDGGAVFYVMTSLIANHLQPIQPKNLLRLWKNAAKGVLHPVNQDLEIKLLIPFKLNHPFMS